MTHDYLACLRVAERESKPAITCVTNRNELSLFQQAHTQMALDALEHSKMADKVKVDSQGFRYAV